MRNPLKFTGDENTVRLGEALSPREIAALRKITPSSDDIIKHMDALSEEITETYPDRIVGQVRVPQQAVTQASPFTEVSDEEFDKSLKAVDEKIAPKAPEPIRAPAPQKELKTEIYEALAKIPGAPTEAQVNALKAKYGANMVHAIAFSESEIFIFTCLNRGQWTKIQEKIEKSRSANASANVENELKESVCQYAVKWPALGVEAFYNSKAGMFDSLYQAIMTHSLFLSPQQVSMLTTQL